MIIIYWVVDAEKARKDESRKAVESGTLNIDGKTLRLSPEFVKEVNTYTIQI